MTAPGPALDALHVTDSRLITIALPDGLEPLEVDYSAVGRRFQPTTLTIRWARTDDRPWSLGEVTASGPVLRKDGSHALTAAGTRRLTRFGSRQPALHPDAPEWARNAIALTSPAVMAR